MSKGEKKKKEKPGSEGLVKRMGGHASTEEKGRRTERRVFKNIGG